MALGSSRLRQRARFTLWRRWALAPIPPPHAYKVSVVQGYARQFGLLALVETGTYLGEMVEASRKNFQRIWSVELDDALYEAASERFRSYPHITIAHGDSSQILPDIVRNEAGPILFWLDGHWSGGITARGSRDTPIVAELATILDRPGESDVILIDDAREFGQGDYPTIETLAKMITAKRTSWHFEVRDDIIRAHRRPHQKSRGSTSRLSRSLRSVHARFVPEPTMVGRSSEAELGRVDVTGRHER